MRPDWNTYFMNLTKGIAERANCPRRKVGCILVNERHQILATGYNGTARGLPNCFEQSCGGEEFSRGEGLGKCQAIHAEANALLFCPDVYKIEKAYVTCFPCEHCIKLLLNTSCQEIVYAAEYKQEEKTIWQKAGRKLTKWEDPKELPPDQKIKQDCAGQERCVPEDTPMSK